MKVVILYRPNSEHDTRVQSLVRDYEHQTGKHLELLSLDTRDGADKARLWDIVQYPALVALDDQGQVLKVWQDEQFPLMNEISWYDRGGSSALE